MTEAATNGGRADVVIPFWNHFSEYSTISGSIYAYNLQIFEFSYKLIRSFLAHLCLNDFIT